MLEIYNKKINKHNLISTNLSINKCWNNLIKMLSIPINTPKNIDYLSHEYFIIITKIYLFNDIISYKNINNDIIRIN